ncbi:hypothetical protein PF010_g20789 [Phytophthora fragariae]|uniref:Uncharacterized protein n=1 Tax=Phytophthora fragariae TaxID=53985 RepID=A0A6A3E8T1_9STRA|nr:hypothetical protein PF003_g34791 [Phytophthora fragariae]KAE8928727.1 hypothetical protein PF009_g21140 [Phytophthora fragariae]KAE9084526.1 hypothetical protein PF010_g20789 [Phytophthora fragariae]KAE9085570.1 hypothetical protein PF007_g21091 [Phytophthora fragariae]KAE9115876.1 hypothetical protein PF006_g19173 [Phytophthora fragariae]
MILTWLQLLELGWTFPCMILTWLQLLELGWTFPD